MTPRETALDHAAEAFRVVQEGSDRAAFRTPDVVIEVAKLEATLAISAALLDIADAIREFAKSERGEM